MTRSHARLVAGTSPIVAIVALAAMPVTGCHHEAPPPATPAAYATSSNTANNGSAATTAAPARQDTLTQTSGSIHIDERIMKACGDVPTAHFAFDSARIMPDAGAVLDAIGRCFVSGPLRGHSMKLIGHADPRGEHEYNFGLGQKRAGSVAAYLSTRSVEASHMQSSSKGDTDAIGTDEAGWARDRKVDLLLAD